MKKVALILGILFMFAAASAQAGFNFGVKALSLAETDATRILGPGNVPLRTSHALGTYFGFDLGPQFVIFAGLDFYRSQLKQESTSSTGGTNTYEESYTSFSPNVGVKYYFKPRTSGEITPYLSGGVFKTFTSFTLEQTGLPPEYVSFYEELYKKVNSPIGFYPAFGVEYYLSNNFSLGGEFGVRFSLASGKASVTSGGTTTTLEINDTFISHYFGVTLNYRFGE